ncbi:MAG: hypothetical protein Q8P11_01355 [bacterium]|nr:hypothetical protein [bacterium]
MSHSFYKIKARQITTTIVSLHKAALSREKLKRLNAMFLLTSAVLGIVYLVQINSLSTKGYRIKELQRTVDTLTQNNEKLQLSAIEKQSMATLRQRMDSMKLVSTSTLDFISTDQPVASAR